MWLHCNILILVFRWKSTHSIRTLQLPNVQLCTEQDEETRKIKERTKYLAMLSVLTKGNQCGLVKLDAELFTIINFQVANNKRVKKKLRLAFYHKIRFLF